MVKMIKIVVLYFLLAIDFYFPQQFEFKSIHKAVYQITQFLHELYFILASAFLFWEVISENFILLDEMKNVISF